MNSRTKYFILLLRIALGVLLLWAGLQKLSGDFSAANYLTNTSGTFHQIFASMSGSSIVNFLVVMGEVGVGSALILGVLTRFACLMGTLMMSLYYLSGFPPAHGLVDQHIVFILLLGLLFVTGAGRYWGIDARIEESTWVKANFRLFRYLLG